MTAYVRYSQVKVGDAVKLTDSGIWRDRRQAEKCKAPFLTVTAIEQSYRGDLVIVAGDRRFRKPKTSKALVSCAYCAPDEKCANHTETKGA